MIIKLNLSLVAFQACRAAGQILPLIYKAKKASYKRIQDPYCKISPRVYVRWIVSVVKIDSVLMVFVNIDVDACWLRVRVRLKGGKRLCFEIETSQSEKF